MAAAIKCYQQSIQFYLEEGGTSTVAKYTKSLADLYKNSVCDNDQAIKAYKAAADIYEVYYSSPISPFSQSHQINNNPASARSCLQDAASLCLKAKQYEEASSMYEKIAEETVNTVARYVTKTIYSSCGQFPLFCRCGKSTCKGQDVTLVKQEVKNSLPLAFSPIYPFLSLISPHHSSLSSFLSSFLLFFLQVSWCCVVSHLAFSNVGLV